MTLREQLKGLLDQHDFLMGGPNVECTPDTISAILDAVRERVPGEIERGDFDWGWNSAIQAVRKQLE